MILLFPAPPPPRPETRDPCVLCRHRVGDECTAPTIPDEERAFARFVASIHDACKEMER